MKKLIPFIFLFLLLGCANEKKKTEVIQPQFAKSLKQAVMNHQFVYKEENMQYLTGFAYYQYIHLQDIKNSFTITDSVKVENLWLIFYKYSINGHDYFHTDWYIKIKEYYFESGMYISTYNVDEQFDKENIDLAKALINKAESWENKSEKHWWKYID